MRVKVLAGLALIACGAAHAADTFGQVLASPAGRYVFGQLSPARSDKYLLDTQTGRIWQVVCTDSPQPAAGALCNDSRLQQMQFLPPELRDGGLSLYPLDIHPPAAAKK